MSTPEYLRPPCECGHSFALHSGRPPRCHVTGCNCGHAAPEPSRDSRAEVIEAALAPFAEVGAWLFARPEIPDDTPMVELHGINGHRGALTRGHFKAAHEALELLRKDGR